MRLWTFDEMVADIVLQARVSAAGGADSRATIKGLVLTQPSNNEIEVIFDEINCRTLAVPITVVIGWFSPAATATPKTAQKLMRQAFVRAALEQECLTKLGVSIP